MFLLELKRLVYYRKSLRKGHIADNDFQRVVYSFSTFYHQVVEQSEKDKWQFQKNRCTLNKIQK